MFNIAGSKNIAPTAPETTVINFPITAALLSTVCDISIVLAHIWSTSIDIAMAWKWEEGGVMCFMPTMNEFRDFSRFIEYMEKQGAHKCGVAKVKALPMTYTNYRECYKS